MTMTKFTDDYFKKKAEGFFPLDIYGLNAQSREQLYLLLKEVAKGVRHACAEVRVENPELDVEADSVYLESFRLGYRAGQQAHADRCMNI